MSEIEKMNKGFVIEQWNFLSGAWTVYALGTEYDYGVILRDEAEYLDGDVVRIVSVD